MSPDWSAKEEPVPYAKLDDPQSLNLYSYVRNNPLSRTDPDGHETPTPYIPGFPSDGVAMALASSQVMSPSEREFDTAVLETVAASFTGGASAEFAASEKFLQAGVAAMTTAGLGTSAVTRTVGTASGVPAKELDKTANAVQTITDPIKAPAAALTGSIEKGSKIGDAVSGVNLMANPKEALRNPGSAALTATSAVNLIKGFAQSVASKLAVPTPPSPKPPGCSVAGACQ